jgi:uncharacterized protein YjbJ (UPF0337 family)
MQMDSRAIFGVQNAVAGQRHGQINLNCRATGASNTTPTRETPMENRTDGTIDKAKGRAKEAMGTVKEKVGSAFGDRDLEARGLAQQGEGKIDRLKGAAKDTYQDAKDTVRAGVDAAKAKIHKETR